jgi:hypothetical protein
MIIVMTGADDPARVRLLRRGLVLEYDNQTRGSARGYLSGDEVFYGLYGYWPKDD